MSTPQAPEFTSQWLTLRESADAEARSTALLGPLREYLAGSATSATSGRPLVVRDLGCGTGSLGRWLSGRLQVPQHWILHDRDPALLALAGASIGDGDAVTVETREGDLTRLHAADLAGTSLVTASALLDLLTSEETDALAAACVEAGVPALLTLSVVGKVELAPADPLDDEIAAAFDAHQRRTRDGRRLLGPDAANAAAEAFERRGARVLLRASPWRLGADQAALAAEWLRGWVGAACEQRPELAPRAADYLSRRLDACAAGELRIVVGHSDLLALPATAGTIATAEGGAL
jgi:hypothetical protein